MRQLAAAAAMIAAMTGAALAQPVEHTPDQQNVVHGAPASPSKAWMLAAGGRIYDNWWEALDRKKPQGTHPAYPATGKREGPTTWRCVECHGWDYKGKDGLYGSGDRYTGIRGVSGAQNLSPAEIARIVRSPPHGYTADMIRDEELARLGAFIREGQHDADQFIDRATAKAKGDATRGVAIFQTVCATCHGFDGRLLDWGGPGDRAYVGTEAQKLPAEVLHKILNAHPGAAMINLRAFPIQDAVDVLTYAQTLPAK